jgi:hypothetical protein
VVFAVQTVCLLAAAAFVWGWLGSQRQFQEIAYVIIGVLAFCELVLLILFFRQKPESDEIGIRPLSDTSEQLVLNLPDNSMLVLDRRRHEILAQEGSVRVPTRDVRFIQVDNSDDVCMLAATQRDLVVLCHLVNPLPRERADVVRVARRLARSAQVPFEEG